MHAEGRKPKSLVAAVVAIVDEDFRGRVLSFDSAAADAYAEMGAMRRAEGRPISHFDAQIAAVVRTRGGSKSLRVLSSYFDSRLSSTMPERKLPTYADVLAAPEHMVAEILLGELHLSPRPARRHGRASTALGADLHSAFERGRGGPGGWILFDEPELHLGEDIVVPDLAGWRRERFPVGEDEEAYFTTPPDWACEVLSKSTARYDRTDKLTIFARERIAFVWLVDPIARTLESLVLEGEKWVLFGTYRDDQIVHAPPFEAVGIELGALWLPEV